ncbi:MAG: TRAP transporter substrate-binding protein [Candidatus Adiutrix sp.]
MGKFKNTALAALSALALVFTMAAAPALATITLKAGHVLAPVHPYHVGMLKFAELVEAKTQGQVKIEVFHSAQLGNARELVEALQMGTTDVCLISTAPMAGFSRDFLIYDLPYVFTSPAQAYEILDGPIGQASMKGIEKANLIGLAFWENGFRNITNSKRDLVTPDDLKGLKIRTMENKIHMATFRALGADPTPIASGEVFTALQQKTVDGQENPLTGIYTGKYYEVQKHLSITEHFYSPAPLLIGKAAWGKLSPELQTAVQEAATEAKVFQRELNQREVAESLESLKAEGMVVTTVDKEMWKKAMAPIYKEFEKEVGADRLKEMLAATSAQ